MKKKFFLGFSSVLLLTWLSLLSILPSLATLRRGNRGDQVRQLQQQLKTQKYYQGPLTGIYDESTQESVKKFQKDQGLKVDGIAGKQTLSLLNSLVNQTSNAQKPSENSDKPQSNRGGLKLKKVITGKISPKSVVHSGTGLFFAQNMMYRHTITVYDRQFNLVKTIPDRINLANFGWNKYQGEYQGSPVEAAFSSDGKYAYISNYQMYGKGFNRPGNDRCSTSRKYDPSFLYRVDGNRLKIDRVIPVGAVPKYTAVSPNNQWVLVSNWCTGDLSVIDTKKWQEIKRIPLGAYPRGIVIDKSSKNAYVAVMGSSNIAKVNLNNFTVNWFKNVGRGPRHLNLDPGGSYLYVTLNSEGKIAKIDLKTGKVIDKVVTGNAPRSMTISDQGHFLYVVNYNSNTVSKVRTNDLKVLQTVKVNSRPIGITYDAQTKQVWVACYSGSILVFQD